MAFLVFACASPAPIPTLTPPSSSPGLSPTAAAPSATPIVTVNTTDLSFQSGGRTTAAYLVAPADAAPGSARGILWFHWLETGAPTSNRTEFLDEAKALAASDGSVSLLVDGTFAWKDAPSGIEHDKTAVEADLAMLDAAYDLLLAQPAVDPARTALVGHDYGAMYSAALFAANERPVALVVMASTAHWADWNLRYWPITDDADAYRAALAPYDLVTSLAGSGGRPTLLQFASLDQYVPADIADEITAAAGPGVTRQNFDTGHELTQEARTERDAWLLANL
ncbi:MAG: hypothetical protein QFC55_02310 [Chloroflexota bacterium]|nr:hypothetical protein [Chloroflexota bacterium]